MSFRIAIVAEDKGGASLVSQLCDRMLLRQEWLADFNESPGLIRQFVPGPTHSDHFHRRDAEGVRVFGKFDGSPGAPDAAAFRQIFAWLKREHAPDAVLVARDSDGEARRRDGLEQASRTTTLRVAVALMEPESEAWRVALVDRGGCAEELAAIRTELGFDPISEPHRLSSSPTSKREAKQIAKRLYGDASPPVDDRALDILSRHEGCGAAQYLRELDAAVVEPIVGARRT